MINKVLPKGKTSPTQEIKILIGDKIRFLVWNFTGLMQLNLKSQVKLVT